MKDYSISMSLVDYLPVLLFTLSSIILQRDLYNKMSKGAFALFAAGTIDVSFAGALKATYKLLYVIGICDFTALSELFFPMQSLGFILAGIGCVAMLCHRQKKPAVFAVALPIFKGTFLFVGMMIGGLGMIYAVLCVLSVQLKKSPVILLFALLFVCILGMGYMSAKDFTQAYMNWVAECVNLAGQLALLIATLILHRHGLPELKLKTGE